MHIFKKISVNSGRVEYFPKLILMHFNISYKVEGHQDCHIKVLNISQNLKSISLSMALCMGQNPKKQKYHYNT